MDTKERTKAPTRGRPTARKASASATGYKQTSRRTYTRRKTESAKIAPEVVYTQPDPFNKKRFLLRIITVVAVVLALLFGMSIFFKVEHVTVTGNNKYTPDDIFQASGITLGENLLTISEAKLSSSITAKLPYVSKVRIGIKLPDTVRIEIEELEVVYSVEANDGTWWLIRSDGVVVEKTNGADAEQHTKIIGMQITDPVIGEPAAAYQPAPVPDENGETTPITVLASEQLNTVVSIMQYLEANRIIGEIATIDVIDLGNLELWYGERFHILLGDTTGLAEKIELIKATIDNNADTFGRGTLDVSQTIQPDPDIKYQAIFTPFAE